MLRVSAILAFCAFWLSSSSLARNFNIIAGPTSPDWTYSGETGPAHWKSQFPLCEESSQSPINFVTSEAVGEYPWTRFTFRWYDAKPTRMTIQNIGHTVEVSAEMSSDATIQGGRLSEEYTFLKLQFHWGSADTQGSEHTVDGVSYPMELHMVHYKTEYGSVIEALKHADGLAVLGVFFEITEDDNANLNSIITWLAKVQEAGSKVDITPFALEDLLPENVNEFYQYSGSLTTPNCDEIVNWIVFKKPVSISAAQMAQFRALEDDSGQKLVDNFRPVQDLSGRTVYKGATSPEYSYSGSTGPSFWPTSFPLCGGTKQSPINIDASTTSGTFSWTEFVFNNYDVTPNSMIMKNNGLMVHVTSEMTSPATVQGGDLEAKYTFLELQFRWGSEDKVGSEHTVDGKRYPSELHMVHFKTEYGNVGEALKHADGLAVLAVFLEISKSDNKQLGSIIAGLDSIREAGTTAKITPFQLRDLLPKRTDEFYRYEGSLTTPTCDEVVTWTVFKNPIPISSAQLKKFRELVDSEGNNIVDNSRPVQPLNGRMVNDGKTTPQWSYEGTDDGPNFWVDFFPSCGGSQQSPIDIVTSSAIIETSWAPFVFLGYHSMPTTMEISNNGHSAKVSIEATPMPKIEGGNLASEYTFGHVRFHWGNIDIQGSEHTMDDQRYPAELHLVHFKTSYENIEEALQHDDGLMILGVLVEMGATDNTDLNNIISGLENIVDTGAKADLTPFPLQNLLPANTDEFYRYRGSLTTPDCNEAVTWTIFKDPITISAAQIDKFRKLEDAVGNKLVNNNRPVQPLNERTVYLTQLP